MSKAPSTPRARAGLSSVELAVLVAVLALLIALVIPGPATHGYLDRVYRDPAGGETEYVLFVPHPYRAEKRYPLIFFMHGAGDGYRVTGVGLGPAIRPAALEQAKRRTGLWRNILKKEQEFPFFVVFPRIETLWNSDAAETRRALKVLDAVESDYRIDPKRIYLTGLSEGGTATWSQAAAQPERWAALVPLSGDGLPELAPKIKHIPCWCFHNRDDTKTPVAGARRMIEALRAAGGTPRYTELTAGSNRWDHNTWDDAYARPELYQWLLKHERP